MLSENVFVPATLASAYPRSMTGIEPQTWNPSVPPQAGLLVTIPEKPFANLTQSPNSSLSISDPGTLRTILERECHPATALALEPYTSLLLNISDASDRMEPSRAHGGGTFRGLLRLIDSLHKDLFSVQAALERTEGQCRNLSWQLHQALEGRAIDGLHAAMGASERSIAAEAAAKARGDLEVHYKGLLAQLDDQCRHQACTFNQEQQMMIQAECAMKARCFGEVEQAWEQARRIPGMQDTIMDLHRRNGILHGQVQKLENSEESLRNLLQQDRQRLLASQDHVRDLETIDSRWRALSTTVPAIAELAEFLSKEAPRLASSELLPGKKRLPVLALEWPPNVPFDVSLVWQNLTATGVYGLAARLCSGEILPEADELELHVCCFNGRWFAGALSPADAPRLAALLMYQALRLDIVIAPYCRVVPAKRSQYADFLELDPKRRSVAKVGPACARSPAAYIQPASQEAVLRAVLRGCPFEQDMLAALCKARKAF